MNFQVFYHVATVGAGSPKVRTMVLRKLVLGGYYFYEAPLGSSSKNKLEPNRK